MSLVLLPKKTPQNPDVALKVPKVELFYSDADTEFSTFDWLFPEILCYLFLSMVTCSSTGQMLA